ncbi:aquaporin-like protein [Xylariaceae sp. FL0594]|nr:aquaporin-like protein [Xylariaceae sp. FL0594]
MSTHTDNNVHFRGDPSHPHPQNGPGGRRRLPMLKSVPATPKSHFVAAVAEFVGTFLFLLFAFGGTNAVNAAPDQGQPADLAANPARLLFISLSFGMSLAVNAWVFYRISGGLFNPAVTIGLMAIGAVGLVRGAIVIVSQLLGGIAAAAVVSGLQPGGLYVATTLGGGTSVVQGFFIEVFLTAELVFTILMLAVEKHRATHMAPLCIGLALFITQMMGVYYTGGSLNPARSFGPAVVTGSFPTYHWIYFIGPILGALLASGFYKLIKVLEYETVNPGQDSDGIGDGSSPFTDNPAAVSPTAAAGIGSKSHSGGDNGSGSHQGTYGAGPSLEAGRSE